MKNKSKSLIVATISIVAAIFVLNQCTKERNQARDNKITNPAKLFLNSVPVLAGGYDYDVALWVDQNYSFFDSSNYIVANTNSNFDTTIINDLKLNNNNYNKKDGLFSIMRISTALMNAVFGNTVTISSGGSSGFSAFNESLYVPSLFNPYYSGFQVSNNGVSASKSAGFTISFNVDNQNTHDNLIYIADLNNPSNALEVYLPYNVSVKHFSAADLSQFPVGAKLDMAIARGNVVYKTHNNSVIQFRAGVIQHCTTFELKN